MSPGGDLIAVLTGTVAGEYSSCRALDAHTAGTCLLASAPASPQTHDLTLLYPSTGMTYVGCFADLLSKRVLAARAADLTATAPDNAAECAASCRAAGYRYAGLQYGSEVKAV